MTSVIIPTYNRHGGLKKTILSIIPLLSDQIELIIVDQSDNRDQYKTEILDQFPEVRYFTQNNPNLPNARNRGIKESKGDIIIFTDDDTIVDENWIIEHIKSHKNHNVMAVAGRVIATDDTSWAIGKDVMPKINRNNGEALANFDLDYSGEVEFGMGCNMSFKRELFNKVGLFDDRYIGNAFYEEIDLFIRTKTNGYNTIYNPKAILKHSTCQNGGTRTDDKVKYRLDHIHNHMLFYSKNISKIPTKELFKYLRGIAEYISRKENGSHKISTLLNCVYNAMIGYAQGFR